MAPEDRPPVAIVFWSFRIMVGLGLVFIAVAIAGAFQAWRGRLEQSPRLLRAISWMIPLPFVAVLAGWIVTEVGRQPWIIQGIMRTSEGVTPSLNGGMVLTTLLGYMVIYGIIFTAGLVYLWRVILSGPKSAAGDEGAGSGTVRRPWSVVADQDDGTATRKRS